MLTTHLFRYTSECTVSQSNFQNFLRLGWQGGIDPLTKILRTFLRPITTAVDRVAADHSWAFYSGDLVETDVIPEKKADGKNLLSAMSEWSSLERGLVVGFCAQPHYCY